MVKEIRNNINEYFKGILFEEKSHTYKYDNFTAPSVSKLIHSFVEEVDWNEKAKWVAKKEGVKVEEIIARWDKKRNDACDRGHEIHSYAEQPYEIKQKRPEDKAVEKFWSQLDGRYILLGKELRMVHKVLRYFGTTDILLWDHYTSTIIIGDYKTNEDLFKNFNGKRLLEPFFFLEDCPYNHYQIQLSMYQLLIEQVRLEVSERWLIYFQGENHKIYKTEDYTNDLNKWFNERKNHKRLHN